MENDGVTPSRKTTVTDEALRRHTLLVDEACSLIRCVGAPVTVFSVKRETRLLADNLLSTPSTTPNATVYYPPSTKRRRSPVDWQPGQSNVNK